GDEAVPASLVGLYSLHRRYRVGCRYSGQDHCRASTGSPVRAGKPCDRPRPGWVDGIEKEGGLFLIGAHEMPLLRFTTAGSVDDGKSTLIGRLLHDAHCVYDDHMESLRKSQVNRSTAPVDLSLLTDGLKAE